MNPQRLKEEIEEMTDFINFLKAEEAKAGAKEFYKLEMQLQQQRYSSATTATQDAADVQAYWYKAQQANAKNKMAMMYTPQTMVWNCEVCGAMNTDPNIEVISFPLKGGHGAVRNLLRTRTLGARPARSHRAGGGAGSPADRPAGRARPAAGDRGAVDDRPRTA